MICNRHPFLEIIALSALACNVLDWNAALSVARTLLPFCEQRSDDIGN